MTLPPCAEATGMSSKATPEQATDLDVAEERFPPIAELVPHQASMCLLDQVVEIGEEHLVASVTPRRHDPFADDQGIPGWVGLEWLAQAIAAWSGQAARQHGDTPRIGFLLGSRHYHCDVEHFCFDLPVTVKVVLDYRADNGLGAFRGELSGATGLTLASATLNVFQPDSADALSAMFEDATP
ncbi:MAG: hotdog family protein [Pseudomonadota bacterium]|nr:hotdog family protein [Pseudomonadota bacterium]